MTCCSRIFAVAGILVLAACDQGPAPGDGIANVDVLPATETSQDFGDYVVHFNAMPTDELTAPIASQYGIVRSASQALLTVSIRAKQTNQTDVSAHGVVRVSATNLTGQLKNITMREIDDNEAVYYIGVFPITNAENLIFTIEVTPEGTGETRTIRYMKPFFVD